MIARLNAGESCPDCGRRLPSPRDLADHMDFHYQQNQEKLKQQSRRSRRYFVACPVWVAEGPWIGMLPVSQSSAVRDLLESIGNDGGSGGNGSSSTSSGKGAAKQPSSKGADVVPLDEANLKCKLCGKCS